MRPLGQEECLGSSGSTLLGQCQLISDHVASKDTSGQVQVAEAVIRLSQESACV